MIPAEDDTDLLPPQASAWNIANALTVLRLALVPVFAWFLLHDGGHSTTYRLLAFGVFAVATATDTIDGEVARAKGLVTDFGKVSDPIADKALMGMALVGLSLIDLLPWWVTVVVLVREVAITALRFVVIRHGIMPASRGGKVKTVLQATAIILFVLPLSAFPLSGFWHAIAVLVMAAAVIVTVATGVDYVLRARKLRQTSPRADAKRRTRATAVKESAVREEAVGQKATGESVAVEASAGGASAGGASAGEASAGGASAGGASAGEASAGEAARHTAGPEV